MPTFKRDDGVVLHYEEAGSGYPLLTFAPGGMRSVASFWAKAPYNPLRELSDEFRVIAMDQRNAGESYAQVTPQDGWHSYTQDQRSLLDHLGIHHCHLLGMCIGGAFALALANTMPNRITAAVLQQPIGFSGDNRKAFQDMFDAWSKELAPKHPQVTEETWLAYRSHMFDGEFVFSITRKQVDALPTPLLVLMGNDLYHPSQTSRDIAALSQNARLIEHWKEPEVVPQTITSVREFLRQHKHT